MIFIPYIQFQAISYHTHILIWYYIILYGLHHPIQLFDALCGKSLRGLGQDSLQSTRLWWASQLFALEERAAQGPGGDGGGCSYWWESLTLDEKTVSGCFFDCPSEFVQCQVRLRKDQWLILTNMWKFWHVCRRLVGDNLPLLCCVQHVGMGHDWISTGFLSQNGRQAALKMTQASSPQGLNVEM